MNILVVGGAGYIGSHMLKALARAGHAVTCFDDLSGGHRDAVRYGTLVEGDLADTAALEALFAGARFDAVMHFASLIQVGESVREPLRYYRNNVANTLNLLDAMQRHGVRRFIFSSTAAVYGEPERVPIDESHPTRPINPYGQSKRMVEMMLEDIGRAQGLSWVALRYFNAAGADAEGELGERHEPETHLIPLVLQAAAGRRPALTVYGEDYATPDGTCVRDYIHVEDLCQAHRLALDYLQAGGASRAFNLGNGRGFSIREVIAAAERVTGRRVPLAYGARRTGDPAFLVADADQARRLLGWTPRYPDLDSIIAHAWAWECAGRELSIHAKQGV
ncbi:MAG: UDP-glucose 4-epimerase GalE [Halothiobacillaceae bacterium]|jgi:UDP-glucose 4-epimerase|nr:UDP-glucose 4-epimerase GalE [Halothiobacillaceae bacterium]MDY0049239.1 UDP-glucose 4-epimerase GalE [Halothiobacillaceae bacterium]